MDGLLPPRSINFFEPVLNTCSVWRLTEASYGEGVRSVDRDDREITLLLIHTLPRVAQQARLLVADQRRRGRTDRVVHQSAVPKHLSPEGRLHYRLGSALFRSNRRIFLENVRESSLSPF